MCLFGRYDVYFTTPGCVTTTPESQKPLHASPPRRVLDVAHAKVTVNPLVVHVFGFQDDVSLGYTMTRSTQMRHRQRLSCFVCVYYMLLSKLKASYQLIAVANLRLFVREPTVRGVHERARGALYQALRG